MSKAQLCLIIVYNCVFGSFIHAQNLIPNPTFINSETRSSVHYPTELMRSPIVPKYWEIVDGYPDFFNDLNSTYIGYPILNTEDGIGGKLGMRMTNSDNEFEAVETMLTNELVKGEKYIISFTMAQCQYSNFSMDMIPFILSNERTSKNNIVDHTTNNLCLLETSQKYLSKDGWKTVRFVYKAKGGEKYFTLINNSYTFARHEKSKVNRTRFNFTGNKLEESSYYFFSEVSVELAAGDTDCEPFVFSPNEDITKDESFETFQTKLQALLKLDLVEVNEKRLKQEHLLNEHTIFLIDISGSMKSGFRNIKRFVLDIMDEMSDQELVSLIVFGASSKIILQRANKENLRDALNSFFADGETNIRAGLNDMDFLIDPNEKTTLEVFTDEKSSVMAYLELIRPNQFENRKTSDLHLKYESNLTPVIASNISNDSTSQRLIQHIYESENPNEYFNFKPGEIKGFQFSKECNSAVQYESISEKSTIEEKITNNVFLIDVSSSMKEGNKLSNLKTSLFTYTATLNSTNRVSVVSFSSKTEVLLDAAEKNDPLFNKVIQDLKGRGTTKVNDGIKYIYNHYTDVKHQNLSFVLFTDGVFSLSEESERAILENQNIHLTIFQFGDRKNQQLVELTERQNLNYKKISPKKIIEELYKLEKDNPFPTRFSLEQPEIWKYFQDNIMEITEYND